MIRRSVARVPEVITSAFSETIFAAVIDASSIWAVPTAPVTTPKPSAGTNTNTGTGTGSSAAAGGQQVDLSTLLGSLSAGNTTSGWTQAANTGSLNTTASGMELTPVWQMATDGGTWYLDLAAGRLVTVVS